MGKRRDYLPLGGWAGIWVAKTPFLYYYYYLNMFTESDLNNDICFIRHNFKIELSLENIGNKNFN
jgi:hypothetical protein